MRKSTLRRTTLLSLIGLSSQQAGSSSTWGLGFTVDNSATSSQENLLPQRSLSDTASSVATSVTSASISGTSVEPNVTRFPGIQSGGAPSRSVSLNPGSLSGTGATTATPSSGSATGSAIGTHSTGAAAPQIVYQKMGIAGALAGAAGVLFV